ncbi:MAG TPA: PAS domain S-box protein [Gaiellaceae bacterium]|nr:PAS domain S-box protein [Gaiellaceae bacterium]
MTALPPGSERPPRLVLRFAFYSALALLAAGLGIFWVVRAETQSRAERELAARGERVAARAGAQVRPSDLRGPVSDQRARALDRAFADELSHDLVLVKLWTPKGVVAYSNDHAIIGARSSEPAELAAAFSGRTLREVTNLEEEGGRKDLKTIEALVPLLREGEPVAALEMYLDYGPVTSDVSATMTPVGVALGLALLLLYATLLPILRQVTKALDMRNKRLSEHAGELGRALEERENAERRLSAAERGYRSLIEQLPLVTYIDHLDASSSSIYISPQVEDLLGYPAVAWLSDAEFFPKVLHPEDRERVLAQHSRAYSSGTSFASEYRLLAKDGRVVWVQDHVMIARDDDTGRPLHAQGFLLDITERKRAEEKLRLHNRELSALHETALGLIDRLDVGDVLETILARACELLESEHGYLYLVDGDELTARLGRGMFESSVGYRLGRGQGLAGRVWETGEPLAVDDYATWPGRSRDFEDAGFHGVVGVPIRSEAQVVGVIGMARVAGGAPFSKAEVGLLRRIGHLASLALENARLYAAAQDELEERRRAEEALADSEAKFRAIVETTAEWVWEIDEHGVLTYSNPAIVRILGRRPEELVGGDSLELLHPEDRESVDLELRGLVERKEGWSDLVLRWRHADGSYRSLESSAAPILDAATGALRGFRGTDRDVTERMQVEAEREAARRDLADQNERLRELDRLKDEFIALVSHELRTPLTSIRGYTELLLDGEAGELTDDQRQFLGVVERNSHRLLHLVGDLLFLAQIEAGKLALEVGDLDLGALASESVEAARPAAEEKDVALTLATDTVPLLAGDRARIGQLLDNLVSNAVKFTHSGGRVDVRVRSLESRAVLEVRDSGIGIPAAEQQFLFQRFFRTSTATEQAIQGTGLGLAISKAIVEAHGGEIEVESEEDVGTTFRVKLPLGQQVSEREQVAVAL